MQRATPSISLRIAMAGLALSFAAPAYATGDDAVRYEFKAGDTLYTFAERFLTDPQAAQRLQRLNKIRDPRRIPVGQEISVPRNLLRYETVDLRVADWSGPVRISGSPVARGTPFAEGEQISTGRRGFVTFAVSGGGTVSMPSNSRARLDRARRYLLNRILDVSFTVLNGRGEAKVQTLRDQERFELRTPVAVTAVRGTEFRVAYDDTGQRGTTEVVEGVVSVDAQGQTQLAEAGFGVASSAEGLRDREALLPPPAFEDPTSIQTAEDVTFAIDEGAAAQAFRVQLARDATFLDVIDEKISTSGTIVFDSIEDGRYFLRGRAIAESGMEGLSAQEAYSFRRKRLGVSAQAEPSPLADGFLFKWTPAGNGKTFFAFQLWDETRPGEKLIDETGLSETAAIVTSLDTGRYGWRVAAMQADEDGLLKIWGPTQTLVVSD